MTNSTPVTAVSGDLTTWLVPLAHTVDDGFRTQASVFEDIFFVFLALGTLVGVVVIGYMLYNGWKYRASVADEPDDPPTLGELPTGQGGGRKLFLSFFLSAVIVVGLIVWTYSALLYVEAGPSEDVEDNMEIEVEASAFLWDFHYENGQTTTNTLVIPADQTVRFSVTSVDVWHTFGVTDLRIKADAIPGQVATEWVHADEPGTHLAECFELCGAGHSDMTAEVIVLDQESFDEWYAEFSEDEDAPIPEPEADA